MGDARVMTEKQSSFSQQSCKSREIEMAEHEALHAGMPQEGFDRIPIRGSLKHNRHGACGAESFHHYGESLRPDTFVGASASRMDDHRCVGYRHPDVAEERPAAPPKRFRQG